MPAPATTLDLDRAVDLTRTGDLWLFRGTSHADRAIRLVTNAPVNHVGMAVVLDDLPPLMWHAELGKGLVDVWTGTHQRGVQLHDLRDAVRQWQERYHQRAWLRQLTPEVTKGHEDAILRTIARLDGTPFPATARLAGRWLRGRAGQLADADGWHPRRLWAAMRPRDSATTPTAPSDGAAGIVQAYCAEVVAVTYEAMGLLVDPMPSMFYDPGSFWSGDDLVLADGYALGEEIAVTG